MDGRFRVTPPDPQIYELILFYAPSFRQTRAGARENEQPIVWDGILTIRVLEHVVSFHT